MKVFLSSTYIDLVEHRKAAQYYNLSCILQP